MKYRTIVIDYPYERKNNLKDEKFVRYGRKSRYDEMTDEQILNFPLLDFCDENCDIFIWTTQKKTPLVWKLIEKLGLTFRLIITWHKSGGIGLNGFNYNSENVIYCTKGKMGIDRSAGKYIPACFDAPITKDSEKPKRFYENIKPRTQEPRIDIFARQRHDGFDAYGNQVEENSITLQKTLIINEGDSK